MPTDSNATVELVRGQNDRRVQRYMPYRESFVLQTNGSRDPNAAPKPLEYDLTENPLQTFTLDEGHWVIFAKLNILNLNTQATGKVSVCIELHVGTKVDTYEMLDIMPQSMRLASLVVGASLTGVTEARLIYRLLQPEPPPPAPPTIVTENLTIASIKLTELVLT
jgi:hypothetical protein